jgi:eukaryotic-like serine/threonine-protein kinase
MSSIAVNGTMNVSLSMTAESSKITIPNLQLRQVKAVKSKLENMGLQIECYCMHSKLPKGTIVAQNPVAGAKVSLGSQITLLVSYGKNEFVERLQVPGVIGLSYDLAVEILKSQGFERVQKFPHLNTPLHPCAFVVAQVPSKGATVDRDTEVFLEVDNF